MKRARSTKPTVLVTDSGRGSALAIIRSLARRGWPVIAADSDRRSLGFRSRYVRGRLVYPPPSLRPRDFTAAMAEAAERLEVDLIVPVTDEAMLPLAEARDRFGGLCRLAIPPAEALEQAVDKRQTVELARELGVPTPRTAVVRTAEEAAREAGAFRWPIVLKPLVSRLYRGDAHIEKLTVAYADGPERLAAEMRRFEGRSPVLMQEYVEGVGLGVELLAYRGRLLAAFQHRRLREVPVNGGASSLRESTALDPELYDYSRRLMEAVSWTGLAMVEFKAGKDGPRLMEINGRVWGSLPLAVHSGMDFPARMAELYLDGPPAERPAPATSYRVGVRSRNLDLDVAWMLSVLFQRRRYPFLAMPPRRAALTALVGLLNPCTKFDIFTPADPLPAAGQLWRIARHVVGKLRADPSPPTRWGAPQQVSRLGTDSASIPGRSAVRSEGGMRPGASREPQETTVGEARHSPRGAHFPT